MTRLFFELSGCKLVSAIFLVLTTLYSPAQAQVLPKLSRYLRHITTRRLDR
jgi:hypothetical protein